MNEQQAAVWALMVSSCWDGAAVTIHSLRRGTRRRRDNEACCPICSTPLEIGSSASWCPTMYTKTADHLYQAEHTMIGKSDYLAFEVQVPRALYPAYTEHVRRIRERLMPHDGTPTRFDRDVEPNDEQASSGGEQ